MHVIAANNVRDALPKAVGHLLQIGEKETSRGGDVLVSPVPVTIRYKNPKQHVLLSPIRDANPFFHIMESMWMLAGRCDSAFLDNYVRDFGARFAKDGIVMDAYGQRWRYGYRYDQLDEIVNQLSRDPTTRQAVLQMWGAGRNDLRAYSMKPCNLIATFRIQEGRLNMSVFNRSNDLIWGCCGANAVHFPILQEYLAGRIGIGVGEYWQISTNLHMYVDEYEKLCKRGNSKPLDQMLVDNSEYGDTQPLIDDRLTFDDEQRDTITIIDEIHKGSNDIDARHITNSFLRGTVIPMALAYRCFRQKDITGAIEAMEPVIADDWHLAGCEWLERRHGYR